MTSFASLGLAPWLVSSCNALSITAPTPIQQQAIPALLQNNNAILLSRTGTGKSLAFALPLLHHLSRDAYGVFALILSPTRELAAQLCDALQAVGTAGMPALQLCLITGGADQQLQATQLAARPHVVVATPGRLAQLLRSDPGLLYAAHLHCLVLDESDRLLSDDKASGGFSSDLATILDALPPANQRQTVLASATLGAGTSQAQDDKAKERMLKIAEERLGMTDTVFISTITSHLVAAASAANSTGNNNNGDSTDTALQAPPPPLLTNHTLTQYYVLMPEQFKECYLHYLLTRIKPYCDTASIATTQLIVFAGSCDQCARLQLLLVHLFDAASQAQRLAIKHKTGKRVVETNDDNESGSQHIKGHQRVVTLHSRMSQGRRLAALSAFRSHSAQILLCTDLAARGLDIPSVSCVVNFETPRDPNDYLHRVGRTSRMGRQGTSITFVTPADVSALQRIEQHTAGGAQMQNYDSILQERKVLESQHMKLVLDAVAITQIRAQQYEMQERRRKQGTKRSYELTRAELQQQNEERHGTKTSTHSSSKQHKTQSSAES